MSKMEQWQRRIRKLEAERASVETQLKLVDEEYEELQAKCEEHDTTPDKIKSKILELGKEKSTVEGSIEKMLSKIE